MIIFFDLTLLGVIFVIAIIGGTTALDHMVNILYGPISVIAIIFLVLSVLWIWYYISVASDDSLGAKLGGAAMFSISNILRDGINIVFLLCIMQGILANMESNHIFSFFITAIVVIGDGLVFFLCTCASIFWSNYINNLIDSHSIVWIGLINLLVSIFYFLIVKFILVSYYDMIIAKLFSENTILRDFLLA